MSKSTYQPASVIEVTRAQALGLVNSGGLDVCKWYRITNPPQPTSAQNATVVLFATAVDRLSSWGHFESDVNPGTTWDVIYDLAANQYRWIKDTEYSNEVRGAAQILAFPYGNADVREVTLDEGTLNYQDTAVIRGVVIDQNGRLDAAAGSSIADTSIGHSARLLLTGPTVIRGVRMDSRAEIAASGGSVLETSMASYARINAMSAGIIQYSNLDSEGFIDLAGSDVTLTRSRVGSGARIYIQGRTGAQGRIEAESYSFIYARGAGALQFDYIQTGARAILYLDDTTADIDYLTLGSNAYFNVSGSGGVIQQVHAQSGSYLLARNVPALGLYEVSLETNGYFYGDDTASIDVRYTAFRTNCRVYARNGAGWRARGSDFGSNSNVNCDGHLAGARVDQTTADDGVIDQRNSARWIQNCKLFSGGTINVNGNTTPGSNANRIYRVTVSALGRLFADGAAAAGYIYYSSVHDAGILYCDLQTGGIKHRINVSSGARLSLDHGGNDTYLAAAGNIAQVVTTPTTSTRFGI